MELVANGMAISFSAHIHEQQGYSLTSLS